MALDVARILAKHAEELAETDMADEVLDSLDHKQVSDVHVLGRRGPAYTAFTTKELRELGQIPDLDLLVDPLDLELDESSLAVVGRDKVAARNLVVLREWADRPRGRASRRVHLHFWTRPVRILGDDRVSGVEVERTTLDADGAVVGRGEPRVIPAQLVVRSVGYRGEPLPGVPHDAGTGRVPHAEGRVIRDGGFSADEYVTGWVKRGPTGVIGTNKSDAVETVTSLLHDVHDGALVPQGRIGALDRPAGRAGHRAARHRRLAPDRRRRGRAGPLARPGTDHAGAPQRAAGRRRRPLSRAPPTVTLGRILSSEASVRLLGSRHGEGGVRSGGAGRPGGTSGRPGCAPGCG